MGAIYQNVAKGVVQNGGSGNTMTWWKTNFNMPVPQLFDGTWIEYQGPVNYNGASTSYDLTGLVPGYELCVFFNVWHWDGPQGAGTAYLYSSWKDPGGSTIFSCANGYAVGLPDIASGYWYEYCYACNIGCAGWEVDVAGTYKVSAYSTGTGAIGTTETNVSFSNVPDTTQLASSKAGYIWVEGNNLCYICANLWKHTIVGTSVGASGSSAGYMWIDTNNDLHWVGGDGNDYKVPWKIQQFASTWSNGPTGSVYAPGSVGAAWVDNEFGWTHISYIGYNGYKWLVGGGNYPYQYP
jgi:hypothetical protein